MPKFCSRPPKHALGCPAEATETNMIHHGFGRYGTQVPMRQYVLAPLWLNALTQQLGTALVSRIPNRQAWADFVAYCEFPFYVRLRCAFLRRKDHEPHPPSRNACR